MLKKAKKIAVVGGLTVVGHVLALLLYPMSIRYLSPEEVVAIGLIESSMVMIVGYLSFGLVSTASRNIALSSDWERVLENAQSSRITLSLLFSLAGMICIFYGVGRTEVMWLLVFSPILACNYDFALYSKGMPEKAALVSVVRQAAPLGVFFLLVLLGGATANHYLLLMLTFMLMSSWLVSRILDTRFIFFPRLSFYKEYFKAWHVGLAGIIMSFQRFGFLSVVGSSLESSEFLYLVTSLKILVFMTGCKRLLIQTFYNRLPEKKYQDFVNMLCFVAAFTVIVVCFTLSDVLSELFFDNANGGEVIRATSLIVVGLYFFAVSDTSLFFKGRYKWMFYSNLLVGGTFAAIIFIADDHFSSALDYLYLLVFLEFLHAVLYKVGLLDRSSHTAVERAQ